MQRDPARQRNALALVDREPLAEGALHMGKAHCAAVEEHVAAMIVEPGLAEVALAARPARVDRDDVAGANRRHAGTHGSHRSGDLVAEDHRLLQANSAEAAMVIVVEVGAADAAGADGDLDLAVAERFLLPLVDPQIVLAVNADRLHSILLQRRHCTAPVVDNRIRQGGPTVEPSPQSGRCSKPPVPASARSCGPRGSRQGELMASCIPFQRAM